MPYKLPSGKGLRDAVLSTHGKTWMYDSVASVGLDSGKYDSFIKELRTSAYGSVDAFLEHRNQWTDYGKLAMAKCLLDMEGKAQLFPPKQPSDHWLEILWQKLYAPTWAEFKTNKLKIVTFNYDRLIERYLAEVAMNHFRISAKEFRSWRFINHVHGSLGPINAIAPPDEAKALKHAMKNILIVHEHLGSSRFRQAERDIRNARTVLFLGFGYNAANMAKLGLDNNSKKRRENWWDKKFVAGTSKGIDAARWNAVTWEYHFLNPTIKVTRASKLMDYVRAGTE